MTAAWSRFVRYLVPRAKLAYGLLAARALDIGYLRADSKLKLIHIGTRYGGRHCCPDLLGAGQTALCCGAGEDISFDVALNARWGMNILCVDPTPRAVTHVEALLAAHKSGRPMLIEAGPLTYDLAGFRPDAFRFLPRAVWSEDGALELFAPRDPAHVSYSAVNLQHTSQTIRVPSSTLATILQECEVSRLALLKLDIEGAEYAVLRSMLAAGIRPEQLLIEFDHINQPTGPLFWVELMGIYRALRAAGYGLVHREGSNCLFVLRRPMR